ncbi:MAG: helix-turn-helix domain-containing protein [Bacilli bacterium]|nr:helix-turn-helix domain-containing protein [Bacilli bacterium]
MNKAYTPFGIYFSNLRKTRKQSITEAAKLLGVSIAYISSVEHGDREIPSDWRTKIPSIYNLNDKEVEELNTSYFETPSSKKISLSDIEYCFTNMINNLFEGEEKEKMLEELKKRLNEFRN